MRGRTALLVVWMFGTLAVNYAQLAIPDFDTLPGTPGKDYPIYAKIPNTSFSCGQQHFLGYYADLSTGCQVYHLCEEGGRQSSFLCPNGTIFNQSTHMCDEWYHVDCSRSPQLFWRNKYFVSKSKRDEVDDSKTNSTNETSKSHGSNGAVENKLGNLRSTSLSKSSLKQFKESLNKLISKQIESKKEDYEIRNNEFKINEEENRKKDSLKRAKTAEKMFVLLDYIDKIKATLADSKLSNSGSVPDNSTNKLFPSIGEKLFKILTALEKKQKSSANTRISDKSNSNFNIVKDVDFFSNYKQYINTDRINQGKKENYDVDINDNSMQGKRDFITDTTAIEMINRILDISNQTLIPLIHETADNKSKSIPMGEQIIDQMPQNKGSITEYLKYNEQFHEIAPIDNSFKNNSNKLTNTDKEEEVESKKDAITSYISDEFLSDEKHANEVNNIRDNFIEDDITKNVSNKLVPSGKNVKSIDNFKGIFGIVEEFAENSNSDDSTNDNEIILDDIDDDLNKDAIIKGNVTKIDGLAENITSTDKRDEQSEVNITNIAELIKNESSADSNDEQREANATNIDGLAKNVSSSDKSDEKHEVNATHIDRLADNVSSGDNNNKQHEVNATNIDGLANNVSSAENNDKQREANTTNVDVLAKNVSSADKNDEQRKVNDTNIDGLAKNVSNADNNDEEREINATNTDGLAEKASNADNNEQREVNATHNDGLAEKVSNADNNDEQREINATNIDGLAEKVSGEDKNDEKNGGNAKNIDELGNNISRTDKGDKQSEGNVTSISSLGEEANIADKRNDGSKMNVTLIEGVGKNLSSEDSIDKLVNNFDKPGKNMSIEENNDVNMNQTNNYGTNMSTTERLVSNATEIGAFGDTTSSGLNKDIDSNSKSTNNRTEYETNTNNLTGNNTGHGNDSSVDANTPEDFEKGMNKTFGKSGIISLDKSNISNVSEVQELSVTDDKSILKINGSADLLQNLDEYDYYSDELIGVLKGLYDTKEETDID